jgi:hypothetical protein
MIALNQLKAQALQHAGTGHVVALRGNSGLQFAIVAIDPRVPKQPQSLQDALAAIVLVHLDPGAAPRLEYGPSTSAVYIDLGAPILRAEPSSFSWEHQYSAAGNLQVYDKGVAIICRTNLMEARVDVQTGHVVQLSQQQHADAYYVSRWELGIATADGGSQKLYEYPPRADALSRTSL